MSTGDRAATIFNGYYTITNLKSGEVREVLIRTQDRTSKFCPGQRVCKLLVGDDRDDITAWKPFAFATDSRLALWKKLSRDENRKRTQFSWLVEILWSLAVEGEVSPWLERYAFEAKHICLKCNRPLTNEASMITGVGPICAGRRKPNPT